ncbi:hypothetical protein FB451DRAFT_1554601 [Mycena latifolia]|nr:hypothetical protein FB451DRAFT_1554601 [Mycena latifolia]
MLFKPSSLLFVLAALGAASAAAVNPPKSDGELELLCANRVLAVCTVSFPLGILPTATCTASTPNKPCTCSCDVSNCNGIEFETQVCVTI